jgi:hypothetical protein
LAEEAQFASALYRLCGKPAKNSLLVGWKTPASAPQKLDTASSPLKPNDSHPELVAARCLAEFANSIFYE